ncbi:hypothetical protein J6590_013008 [Homalodisca vitripennis]|nr:hypothetical protein J6590_092791 [Homalodisca vitripennis]KAG8323014.1 hypothetical protein J6590_013008 [Homalodisca vitripennis]
MEVSWPVLEFCPGKSDRSDEDRRSEWLAPSRLFAAVQELEQQTVHNLERACGSHLHSANEMPWASTMMAWLQVLDNVARTVSHKIGHPDRSRRQLVLSHFAHVTRVVLYPSLFPDTGEWCVPGDPVHAVQIARPRPCSLSLPITTLYNYTKRRGGGGALLLALISTVNNFRLDVI